LRYWLIPVFLVAAGNAKGQAGANCIALGGNAANPFASISLVGNAAIFNSKSREFGFWGTKPFTGTSILRSGIAGHISGNNYAVGFSDEYSGTGYYFRNSLFTHFAQKWNENTSAGISIGYLNIHQAMGFESGHYLEGKLGLHSKLGKKSTFSMVIKNPWVHQKQVDYTASADISVGYILAKNSRVFAQFQTGGNKETAFGLALLHSISEKFKLRGAMQTGHSPVSAGLEYQKNNFYFSFAGNYHLYLGFTPSFTLVWKK